MQYCFFFKYVCFSSGVIVGGCWDWCISSHLWLVAGYLLPGLSICIFPLFMRCFETSINSDLFLFIYILLLLCLQEMFDASLKDRELSFESAPGTTMFLHWLVGMVYVFYFASFILLLREVPLSSQCDLGIRVQACSCHVEYLNDYPQMSTKTNRFSGPESCGSSETLTTRILTRSKKWSTFRYTDIWDASYCQW